jgi:UDP-glucose:(heptosyl)LPS alpha-1,3-glucosyltransferase
VKIALVLDSFDAAAGGLERWTIGFAEHLCSRGHDVHVVAFGGVARPGVTLHTLPPCRSLIARARRVERCLAGLGAQAVLDTGTGWSGDVFLPCTGSRRWSQARLVATHSKLRRLRALLSPRSRWLAWEMFRLEREQVRRAKRVLAVSPLVRDLLLRQHRMAPERVVVIPNGIEIGRFGRERMAGLRQEVRAGLGTGGATLFLGSAHNMHLKGMDTAIRAVARLVAEGREVQLVLAGGTPDAFWTALAAPLGARVRFLGLVDDMAKLFAAADALVHPTRWDACSLSTIEAGAAGLPVITTRSNGAAALIENGVTGFVLADPEDEAALVDAMRRLLDPVLRARMGEAARAASRSHAAAINYAATEAVLLANSPAGNVGAAGS